MRIGIDASRAARAEQTGTEAYSCHLIRALIESRRHNEIILYSPTAPSESLWAAGASGANERCPVRIIPFPRLWTHVRLNWELRRHAPDLLFVPAHVMPVRCPTPAVVTVHDLGYLYYPDAHRRFDRWYLDWTTRRHTRSAACIIADSEATRADLIRHYGAEPNRIRVIFPGRDETLQRVEDPVAVERSKARCGIRGPYMLYLGTLQPRKNLVRLVDAFARVPSWPGYPSAPAETGRLPAGRRSACSCEGAQLPLQLVLAGKKGWLYENLFHHVAALGLQNRVLFPGYVASEDKAALLSGACALVFPTLYEGFGMPVVEAMTCGVPVLTSNISSLPEVAGDAALLVDPLNVDDIADGMVRLLSDRELRRSLTQKGYARARQFSWQRAAAQLWEVFDSLVR